MLLKYASIWISYRLNQREGTGDPTYRRCDFLWNGTVWSRTTVLNFTLLQFAALRQRPTRITITCEPTKGFLLSTLQAFIYHMTQLFSWQISQVVQRVPTIGFAKTFFFLRRFSFSVKCREDTGQNTNSFITIFFLQSLRYQNFYI